MVSRQLRRVMRRAPQARAVEHARKREMVAPPRIDAATELRAEMRESAIRYYLRSLAELAQATDRARLAYASGDERAIRRALVGVGAANRIADRYSDELAALLR